jgi:THO complex subunit 4
VGGRPRKTAEELDAEMDDYWGGAPTDAPTTNNGGGQPPAAATAGGDDIDMIE